MKLLSLQEFRKYTGLSDRTVVALLSSNALPCSVDSGGGIQIDIDQVSPELLLKATITPTVDALEADRRILTERFARIISDNIDSIMDEALSQYLSKRAG